MKIRLANVEDQTEVVALYERSQDATSLPSPAFIRRSELGTRLYARPAIARYVALETGRIVGHALIETPNPEHINAWQQCLGSADPLIEMGGAFVEPTLLGNGIWTSLLLYRLDIIRKRSAIPVAATWSVNEHVKKTFLNFGGIQAGQQATQLGAVSLFVFR